MNSQSIVLHSAPDAGDETSDTDLGAFLNMLTASGQSYNLNYDGDVKIFNVTFSAGEPTDGAHIRARLCFSSSGNLIRAHRRWTVATKIVVGLWKLI